MPRSVLSQGPSIAPPNVVWRLSAPTVALLLPIVAYAALPNQFESGTTLTAAALNQNFGALDERLSNLEAQPRDVQFVANPWIQVGSNTSFADWDALRAKYSQTEWEWAVARNGGLFRVNFSQWNHGWRISTEEYMQGDGFNGDNPPTDGSGFWRGGSMWIYETAGDSDDACTNDGRFRHWYWQRSSVGVTLSFSNGCAGESFFVRRL